MQTCHASSPVSNAISFGKFSSQKLYLRSEYQLDFFPTGKGGAAICLRYGSPGDYRIVVYDGGTLETGRELIAHMREKYGTNVVDDVICSHPDADHAAGLREVLAEMDVRCFWMHRPWRYSPVLARHFFGKSTATPAQALYFDDAFAVPHGLEGVALRRGIEVAEPFQGAQIGPFTVMSPHRDWYVHKLIPKFENPMPANRLLSAASDRLLQRIGIRVIDPSLQPPERWEVEALQEGGTTSAENESSVVLFGKIGRQGILLTGDSGIRALSSAVNYAEYQRLLIPAHLNFVQIPHHGDHNHVSPSVLDRLIGPKLRAPAAIPKLTAMVFPPDGDETYPNGAVVNALIRRGAQVTRVASGNLRSTCRFGDGDSERNDAIRYSSGR